MGDASASGRRCSYGLRSRCNVSDESAGSREDQQAMPSSSRRSGGGGGARSSRSVAARSLGFFVDDPEDSARERENTAKMNSTCSQLVYYCSIQPGIGYSSSRFQLNCGCDFCEWANKHGMVSAIQEHDRRCHPSKRMAPHLQQWLANEEQAKRRREDDEEQQRVQHLPSAPPIGLSPSRARPASAVFSSMRRSQPAQSDSRPAPAACEVYAARGASSQWADAAAARTRSRSSSRSTKQPSDSQQMAADCRAVSVNSRSSSRTSATSGTSTRGESSSQQLQAVAAAGSLNSSRANSLSSSTTTKSSKLRSLHEANRLAVLYGMPYDQRTSATASQDSLASHKSSDHEPEPEDWLQHQEPPRPSSIHPPPQCGHRFMGNRHVKSHRVGAMQSSGPPLRPMFSDQARERAHFSSSGDDSNVVPLADLQFGEQAFGGEAFVGEAFGGEAFGGEAFGGEADDPTESVTPKAPRRNSLASVRVSTSKRGDGGGGPRSRRKSLIERQRAASASVADSRFDRRFSIVDTFLPQEIAEMSTSELMQHSGGCFSYSELRRMPSVKFHVQLFEDFICTRNLVDMTDGERTIMLVKLTALLASALKDQPKDLRNYFVGRLQDMPVGLSFETLGECGEGGQPARGDILKPWLPINEVSTYVRESASDEQDADACYLADLVRSRADDAADEASNS